VPRSVIHRRILYCMLIGMLFGVVVSEASFHFLNTGETRPPKVIELDIPLGTADRVARGIADPNLPSSITFVAGDTLRVNNQDSVVHQLGPLWVPPDSSATMQLDSATDMSATCSFQPSKYIGLNIQSPLTLVTRLVGIGEAGIPMGFLIAVYSLFAVPVRKRTTA
jgi:hypothetical protein